MQTACGLVTRASARSR